MVGIFDIIFYRLNIPIYVIISITKKIGDFKMNNNIVNREAWIPTFFPQEEQIYILLTSLNLGGAEKIVSDQLWANFYQKNPHKVTLFVIYDKNKEHSIPPNVNIVRLNNRIENGEILFRQIAYSQKPVVCHLINDEVANYLFHLNLKIHMVIHNDKKGWNNTDKTFNNSNVISLISVCDYVTKQLREVVKDKPIYTIRHQISYKHFQFNSEIRDRYRKKYKFSNEDIIIGMTGRICSQKNYFLALDVIAYLSRKDPRYKLVILGGFEKSNVSIYFEILNKANSLNVQKSVRIPGFKNNAVEWINMFDIGLNVSHFEGLSMATQEFMMNGLQMIASNVSGQPEIYDQNEQLHFFDFPETLNKIETKHLNIDMTEFEENKKDEILEYKKLVKHISKLIELHHSKRIELNEQKIKNINQITYGSHNLWSLFNFIKENKKNDVIRPAFLTSNLNLGGAQRSLVNLLCEMKTQNVDIPLILLNQSNYTGFYKTILDNKIEHYLCHSNVDVFAISTNLIKYIFEKEINRIVLWNVDSKVKFILNKLLGHYVDIIDVSPGDYCFIEMDQQINFQEAIYIKKQEYFKNIKSFVSKFDNSDIDQEYKKYIHNDTVIIPNGVPFDNKYINVKEEKFLTFKFVVCGRITESKHIDTILQAFNDLYRNNENISIDLYGSVEPYNVKYYEDICDKYSYLIKKEKIIFHGNIDDPRKIMDKYNSIIIIGTHQGSPNMVLESVSCKLPCITNDSGGTREIIKNNETGILLSKCTEVKELYEAMKFSIENYKYIISMSEKAYEYTLSNFSMKSMYEKYMKVIFD